MISRTRLILMLLRQGCDPAQILVKLALRHALTGCESVLDVGCGTSLAIRELGLARTTGIEGFSPTYDEAKRLKTHDQLVLGDIRQLDSYFHPGQFDACVALDVIEHLDKQDGLKLLQAMEKVCKRRCIILTPSGFLPQGHTDQQDLQVHLSGWEAAEMASYGYQTVGLLGPRKLRGEYHALKYRPRILWGVASLLSHFAWTRWHPAHAAALLCIKRLDR